MPRAPQASRAPARHIEAAHESIQRTHGKEKGASTERAEIQAKQLTIDKTLDLKARGTHSVLTGFADLADDPEGAALHRVLAKVERRRAGDGNDDANPIEDASRSATPT